MIVLTRVSLSGAEGFTSEEDQEVISRIEKQLKRRFAIGSQVSENSIVQDFTRQVIGVRTLLEIQLSNFCVLEIPGTRRFQSYTLYDSPRRVAAPYAAKDVVPY